MDTTIKCPVCTTACEQYEPIIKAALSSKKNYEISRCSSCGAAFFHPMPSPQELELHYSNDYAFYKPDNFKAVGKGSAFAAKYLKHLDKGNFLDIGCASGDFLSGVQQGSNWEVFGTDINSEIVDSAKKKFKYDIRLGEIKDVGFEENFFDFVHVHDVLEHVTNPMEFLRECKRILKPDGTIYLSVPNGEADLQNMITYYTEYNIPAFNNAGHLFFFPYRCLQLMFKSVGFKIKKSYTYNFKNGLRSFSLWPKRKNWQQAMTPPSGSKKPTGNLPNLQAHPKRPEAYYRFTFFMDELNKIPGIYRYGQDYIIILKLA